MVIGIDALRAVLEAAGSSLDRVVRTTVYLADLGNHRTFGLGISTGRVFFEASTGSFDPVISDSEHLYLTGFESLYGLAPK